VGQRPPSCQSMLGWAGRYLLAGDYKIRFLGILEIGNSPSFSKASSGSRRASTIQPAEAPAVVGGHRGVDRARGGGAEASSWRSRAAAMRVAIAAEGSPGGGMQLVQRDSLPARRADRRGRAAARRCAPVTINHRRRAGARVARVAEVAAPPGRPAKACGGGPIEQVDNVDPTEACGCPSPPGRYRG